MSKVNEFINNMQGCNLCYSEYFKLVDGEINNGARQVWKIFKDFELDPELWKNLILGLSCPKCRSKLELDSYVIEEIDKFVSELIDVISVRLNENIEECEVCDAGIIMFQQRHGDPLTLRTVWEYLDENSITESLGIVFKGISSKIKCKCGAELYLDTPFVTSEEVDYWYGERDKEVIIKTFDINERDAETFINYLYKYPMLGLECEIGRKIYNLIKRNDVEGVFNISSGEIFYRARKRNIVQRQVPFISSELWAPPIGLPGHGRFNPVGVQVLYLCNSPKTGIKEIDLSLMDKEEVAEVGKFITLNELKIWDVRELDIKEFITMPSLNNRTISKEYLLPNFLAQCFSLAGFDGIMYESVKNICGWNLALFNYEENKSIALVDIIENCKLEDSRG